MNRPFIIGIAGGSASGKSTFSKNLREVFAGMKVTELHMDSYFKPAGERPVAKAPITGKEYMDDLTERDQRMMFAVVTLTHLADSLEQLDQDTESLQSRTRGCEFSVLKYQQEDGLNTVLP